MTQAVIEIRTHQEEFTEPEIFLRRELEQAIPESLRAYTTESDLNSLKEYRSTSDTFYPENHFYAFNGDELIGFIHLWPTYQDETVADLATISVPYVRDQDRLVMEQLFSAVSTRARELGVKTLQINAESEDQLQLSIINEFDFKYNDINRVYSRIPVDQLRVEASGTNDILDFDMDEHGEKLLQMYEALGHEREAIENQFNWIEDLGDRLLAWKVAESDGKLLGQALCFAYPHEEGDEEIRAQLNVVTRGLGIDDETYETVTADIYADLLETAKNNSVTEVELNILPQVLEVRPLYESFGFEFKQSDSYQKPVDQI